MIIKRKILLIIIFLYPTIGFSQKDTTIFLKGSYEGYIIKGKIYKGKRIGLWNTFRPDSTVEEETYYHGDSVVKKSYYNKYYFAEGISSYSEGLYTEGKIILNGKSITYYPNSGNIKSTEYYVNGLQEDSSFIFYENGNVYQKTFYLKGKEIGKVTMYYKNGNPMVTGYVIDGNSVGEYQYFYESGQLKEKGEYLSLHYTYIAEQDKNQKWHIRVLNEYGDTVLIQNESEVMKTKIILLRDRPYTSYPRNEYFKNGLWQYWNEFGIIEKEEFYEKGKLIKVINY